MAYLFSGFGRSACASSSGFGCWPTDELFLDKTKVLYANQAYQARYKRDIPERVAAQLRDKSGYCTKASVDEFVRLKPPIASDRTSDEVLEEQANAPPPLAMPPLPPRKSTDDSDGLPKWAIPAAGALALVAVVLVLKKKKKA